MSKKRTLFFSIIFLVTLSLLFVSSFIRQTESQDALFRDSTLLLQTMEQRFGFFIDGLISRGIIFSKHLTDGQLDEESYKKIAASTIKHNNEIYGLNLLDRTGKIIRVYPYETNKHSLNKVTQNLANIRQSLKNGDEFWLSPPFQLYQGIPGFVVYIPLKKKDQLVGWIAPVVSMDLFFKKFIDREYLKNYHLIIEDDETKKDYFKTHDFSSQGMEFVQHSGKIRGRAVTFISWPREKVFSFGGVPGMIAISVLLAFVATWLFDFFEKQDKTVLRMNDVENVIRASVQDASSYTILIQNQLELIKRGATHVSIERITQHMKCLGNLLEQVKMLQKIYYQEEAPKLVPIQLSSIINEVSLMLHNDLLFRKMKLVYHKMDFEKIEILGQRWLLTHAILGNILGQTIYQIAEGHGLELTLSKKDQFCHITIQEFRDEEASARQEEVINDNILTSSKRVLQLLHGDLLIKSNSNHFITYVIILPMIKVPRGTI